MVDSQNRIALSFHFTEWRNTKDNMWGLFSQEWSTAWKIHSIMFGTTYIRLNLQFLNFIWIKNAYQSKAHLSLADKKSNIYKCKD